MLDGALAAPGATRSGGQCRDGRGTGGGSGLARALIGKTVSGLITLFFVMVFNFFLFRVLPADPASNLVRDSPR